MLYSSQHHRLDKEPVVICGANLLFKAPMERTLSSAVSSPIGMSYNFTSGHSGIHHVTFELTKFPSGNLKYHLVSNAPCIFGAIF